MFAFSIKNRQVTIDPVSLAGLGWAKDIWDNDGLPNKEYAIQLLTYIHLVSQIDQTAPFSKADHREVSSLVKNEVFGKYEYNFLTPYNEKLMEQYVTEYQLAFEPIEEATLRSYNKKIHEIRKLIDDTKIVIKESNNKGSVTFVSNFPIINSMMKDLIKIAQARDDFHAMTLRDKGKDSGKGNKKKSLLEKRRRTAAPVEERVEDLELDEL